MRDARLRLEWIRGAFAVCRLPPTDDVPEWATAASSAKRLLIVTRTDKELSVVIGQEAVPEEVTTERGWVAMRISDSLDLSMTGVLSTLTGALAESGVSVFAELFELARAVACVDLGQRIFEHDVGRWHVQVVNGYGLQPESR